MCDRNCSKLGHIQSAARSTEAHKLIKTLLSNEVEKVSISIIKTEECGEDCKMEFIKKILQYITISPRIYIGQGVQRAIRVKLKKEKICLDQGNFKNLALSENYG